MKILYLVNGITGSGGLERVLSIKASLLADHHSCDVMIVSLDEDVREPFFVFSDRIRLRSLKVRHWNPFRHLWAYRSRLQGVVDEFRPDIVCVCDDALKGFLVPMFLRTNASLVYERHSSKKIVLGQRKGFGYLLAMMQLHLMDLLGRRFDAFVVLSKGGRSEWPFKTRIIANPISFFPVKPASLDNRKVIAVGRQVYAKGYDLLLPAWRRVQERHPDWVLEIYGKKEPRLQLDELAKKNGISGSVRFLDPVKNIESKFLDASIFVLSSRFEGFAMVLTEAMSCGLPCVAFDCPNGPSDIIESGRNGILVPAQDIDGLSESLCVLMESQERRKAMGGLARVTAAKYSPDQITAQWLDLFSEIRG